MAKQEKSRVKLAVLAALLLLLLAGAIGVVQLTERLGAETQPPESSSQPSEIADSSESHETSEQETTSCAILTDGEWVDYPCDENPFDWSEDGSSGAGTGSSRPGSSSSSTSVTPRPNSSAPRFEFPLPGANSNQEEVIYCPDTREENPAIYDACRAGFVAPTFEWAGYYSCERLSTDVTEGVDDFGNPYKWHGTVNLVGLVRMVGGNYKEFSHGRGTINGLVVQSGVNIVEDSSYASPYVIYWDIHTKFYSMDSRYYGVISEAFEEGRQVIQLSQVDPSCKN